MLDYGKSYFHSGRSGGNLGFGQSLPAVIVREALHLERRVLYAMDDLGRSGRIFDDVEPVAVLKLLRGCELGLRQGYTAISPGGADGLYFDMTLDIAGGVAGLDVVPLMERGHFGGRTA